MPAEPDFRCMCVCDNCGVMLALPLPQLKDFECPVCRQKQAKRMDSKGFDITSANMVRGQ